MVNVKVFRVAFALVGMLYGVFVSRLPAVKLQAGLDDAQVGFMLLALSCGAVSAFMTIGIILRRFQTREIIVTFEWLLPAAMVFFGFMSDFWGLIAAAAVIGFMIGACDVTMNAQAILLERQTKRRYLSGMHAFYSFGGFLGAGFGSVCAVLTMNAGQTFAAFLVLSYALIVWAGKGLLPDEVSQPTPDRREAKKASGIPLFTFVCGFFALCAYVVEGTVGEWGGIFLVTVKGADEATAGLTFGLFSATVAFLRLFGDKLRQCHGDFTVFSIGSVFAVLGMSIVLMSSHPWGSLTGYVLLGVGLFPTVPIALSRAAAQDGISAAKASAVVSFMGYTGLLVVPPVLGNVAKAYGLDTALMIPLVCCTALLLGSWTLRTKIK